MTRNRRFYFIASCLLILSSIFLYRILSLLIRDGDFLRKQADLRATRIIATPAYRGMIVDRNHEPLAVSTATESLCANPKEVSLDNNKLAQVAQLINLDENTLSNKLQQNKNKEFIYIKRHLPAHLGEELRNLHVPGFFLQQEYKRFYPHGEMLSQLIGITDLDNKGVEGIELTYDQQLAGTSGSKRVTINRLGEVIEEKGIINEPKSGEDIKLTIDLRLQYIINRKLKELLQDSQAKAGFIVMLDVVEGEIVAMANQPAFNPNLREQISPAMLRNHAVSDLFEPGSAFKPIMMAGILEHKKIPVSRIIDTSPGYLKIDDYKISDVRNYGALNLIDIIKKSSNVGMAKLALDLGEKDLLKTVYDFGFLFKTTSGLNGEASGLMQKGTNLAKSEIATLSFGYGILVNSLQLLNAYATLARDGIYLPISITHEPLKREAQERVVSPFVAHKVMEMIHQVVDKQGTGRRAQLHHYTAAGKTGTVRILDSSGAYAKDRHNALFVGVAPLVNTKLALLIYIEEPQGKNYYGGIIAAPAFRDIMEESLRILGVAPDKV